MHEVAWYRRVRRWGQTNLTEVDAATYDRELWKRQWRRTRIGGIIVNAGGIVAYYPSTIPLHYRAARLGERDLLGEIVEDARDAGLAVLARMDCNRATPEFRDAHPDWFVTRADGTQVETQGRFVACVNSPYYKEHIPRILAEIIDRYHPDGFTDNSWTGAGYHAICWCPHCREKFDVDVGGVLPDAPDWDDPRYRAWVRWSYRCREENWDLFNRVAGRAGASCLWLGMVGANPFRTHLNFADLAAIGARVADTIVMCDHQARDPVHGFEQNAINGLLLHDAAGWEATIPESIAHYARGRQAFRRSSMPPEETRHWFRSGAAGGISPWWHHVGAAQEDRRQLETTVDLFAWHEAVERHLVDRRPVADVGLLWSHENIDFWGRDERETRCELPWRGWTAALTRARRGFRPVHASHVPADASEIRVLIAPGLAVMSDETIAAIESYVAVGGSLILTGPVATLDENGAKRDAWPLEPIVGHRVIDQLAGGEARSESWEVPAGHTYLRLPDDPAARHPILDEFADTSILPFGGALTRITRATGSPVLTWVPPFPIYPPEFSWMREPASDLPAVITRDLPGGGRLVHLLADLDRQYGRLRLPDHATLLSAAIAWTAGSPPWEVHGPGRLSCHLWHGAEGVVVHLLNVTGTNEWPGYLEEVVPVGPIDVILHPELPVGVDPQARSLVTGATHATQRSGDRVVVRVERVEAHEVFVVS